MKDYSHFVLLTSALCLFLFAFIVSLFIGISTQSLFIFGIISGIIYAFTNANDKRIRHGRKFRNEKSHLDDSETFIAIAGSISAIITWVSLIVIYLGFSFSVGYKGNLGQDIMATFSAPMILGDLSIPYPFLFAGISTVIATWTYLEFIREKKLGSLGVFVVCIFIIEGLFGVLYFHDSITQIESILFILAVIVIFAYIYFTYLLEKTNKAPTTDGPRFRLVILIVLFIFFTFLSDFICRSIATSFTGDRKFFISIIFRALYFSLFLIYGGYWFIQKYKSKPLDERRNIREKIFASRGLIAVTIITIILTFFLKIPVLAYNFIVGPLSYLLGNYATLLFIGIIYGVDGTKNTILSRMREEYCESRLKIYRLVTNIVLVFIILAGILYRLQ